MPSLKLHLVKAAQVLRLCPSFDMYAPLLSRSDILPVCTLKSSHDHLRIGSKLDSMEIIGRMRLDRRICR